jgi:hypothetical protein
LDVWLATANVSQTLQPSGLLLLLLNSQRAGGSSSLACPPRDVSNLRADANDAGFEEGHKTGLAFCSVMAQQRYRHVLKDHALE